MKKYSQERKDMILQLVAVTSMTPAQIKQIEKEMTCLRKENEFLKKAMVIFTK
ncbi:hypothetical protein QL852_002820 [Enterococcus faecalis]|uniref:hypothetical protein n=1 Tax=Enterococcus faecalis TaxID=1351 RepID=UPI00032ECE2D|nr:hypothetical protein [Enterococcus faecalis]MDT6294688.1 hypothetical protein [Enterococcus faecium]EHG5971828.1 hypothetical protein [Enterococcus faecalis]EKZ0408962.1 hypothetical protein [Enterococcus faecalis]EOE00184.1 hypothetical protein Q9I_00006 [Enterococcus faecalis EnGen0074]EOE03706.1 hypothetical protein Q9O_01652 [Enterococcus faecalis EnGen0073]